MRAAFATLAVVATVWLVNATAVADTLRVGDPAPMAVSVDEHMQLLDMAEFIDGTPLVLLYGSAT
jgi:hypothetical protein